jgi:hypothetical protein
MKGNLWQVIVVVLALALLLPVADAGLERTAFAANETDQGLTVDYDAPAELSVQPQGDVYEYQSLNVTDNGTTLTAGSDYAFNESEGAIYWINDSTNSISDGDTYTASYQYLTHDDDTQAVDDVLSRLAIPLGFLLLIVAMGWLVTLIGGGDW